jgi:hypothetical protein
MDDQEQFLSRSQQARRYNKSYRTIERWGEDPELGFPLEIEINGRFFRKLSELEEFERRLATVGAAKRELRRQGEARKAEPRRV